MLNHIDIIQVVASVAIMIVKCRNNVVTCIWTWW